MVTIITKKGRGIVDGIVALALFTQMKTKKTKVDVKEKKEKGIRVSPTALLAIPPCNVKPTLEAGLLIENEKKALWKFSSYRQAL